MIIDSKVYLKGQAEDKQMTSHAKVVQVKTGLEPLMKTLTTQKDPIDAVRNALRDEHGEDFSEPASGEWVYHWRWDPELEKFVKVCVWTATFEIDFGSDGIVIVYIDEGTEY